MSNQAFFKVMLEAIKEEVEVKLNGTLMVSYAEHSITKQIADVEEMIDNKIDFLLFNAVDSEAAEPAIVIAKNAGIPVVCLDVDAVGPRDIYIGSDNYQAGVLCGEYIVERLQGKGKVAILNGNPVSSVRMRYNGFIDVIKKNPDIKIIAEENGDGDFIKSVNATELILENYKKIDAIYAVNDPSALGALAAVEVANQQKGLFIVGIDGSPDAVQAVLNHTAFAATAAQDPAKIGQLGVKYGLKLLVQEKVPNTFPVKVKLIKNDNAKGFSW
ncbi:substrate-binding domain-containing protein [Halocella sp. SP3-1]|uniref:substrate-binding domain-containing protein n=1 Tax=Halocella sp. SP3-1 TaxID=2382161 RepID=UPI0013E09269|nr:substrate-binding domain-containing protein [Halocella sp. SP3-1]